MSHYIGQYVKTCDLCLHTKAEWHLPIGELSLLPTLEFHWDTISADFIIKLPESHGYDCSNYRVKIDTVEIKNLEDFANRNSSVTVRTLIH